MPAPKGNQFWKLRSKHGRDKLFESPELLWEACCEYFKWCDDNPFYENKVINSSKDGVVDHPSPKLRAYTMTGLCLYLGCSTQFFRNFEDNNQDSEDFMATLKRIQDVLYEQKFTAAAADLLNAGFIGKAIGLVEKQEIKADIESNQIDYSQLSKSALEEIANQDQAKT